MKIVKNKRTHYSRTVKQKLPIQKKAKLRGAFGLPLYQLQKLLAIFAFSF